MAKLAIVATCEVAPGRMDEFLPLMYEVYADEAAFKVHWDGAHVTRIRAETAGMMTKLTGIRCSLLD